MIEQKRLTLKHSNWPVLTPEFPIPHLWLGFFQPIKTPACQDTAAIFLFSANDSSLREHSPVLRDLSPQEWKVLHDNVYEPERDLLSLNVVDTHGKIVWSMSLPATVEEARKHSDQRGLVPAWFQCPHHTCRRLRGRDVAGDIFYSYQLCQKCRQAQLYFSTWLMTAWQALMGAYRDEDLDDLGSGRVERFHMASSYLRNIGSGRNGSVENRYRIISYKDISKRLSSPWHSSLRPTSSWVEALMAFDPELVTWQEKTVLPHYRTLRSPRVNGQPF